MPDKGNRTDCKWDWGLVVYWGMHVVAFVCLFGWFCPGFHFFAFVIHLLVCCLAGVSWPREIGPIGANIPIKHGNWGFRYVGGCVHGEVTLWKSVNDVHI